MGKPGRKPKPKPTEQFLLPGSALPMRTGDRYANKFYGEEESADDMLADQRRELGGTVTGDYLSYEQVVFRHSREIVNVNGVPDGRLMQGLYRRVYNPLAGDRPSALRRGDD